MGAGIFTRALALAAGLLLAGCGSGGGSDSTALDQNNSGRSLFVSASAAPGGNGSREAPFDSLPALEKASRPGDTLVVLPSPVAVPPLNDGITLKPGQRLIGGGPPVLQQPDNQAVSGAAALEALPRIRNTNLSRQLGDVVRLAPDSEVRNLVITESLRGGVYGLNTPGSIIRGNDISGYNTSCAIGFIVEPFVAPTRLPLLGIPLLLPAGWAGILVDANRGQGQITISDNYVHNSACGNGIDVRINGNADYFADISGNFVTELEDGPGAFTEEIHLVHAITTQITDNARLEAFSVNNRQTFIGSPGADCEGLFMNLSDTARGSWTIDRNEFAHGIGGFSCNGMELVVSNGSPRGEMFISNSSFIDNPGDMLQQDNLGSGSTLILELDNVLVRDTTERPGDPDQQPLPFNLGECILAGSTGPDNTTILRVRDSEFSNCNNGLTLLSGVSIENGVGADGLMRAEVSNSRFTGNAFNNIYVGVITGLRELEIKVGNSDLSAAGRTVVRLLEDSLADVQQARIDFGGGALGSSGGNCILGGGRREVSTDGLPASLRNNWWGQPGGPAPERLSATPANALDTQSPLAAAPAICADN